VKKLKVWIVDDSSVMRRIIERALRQAGLDLGEVLEASNGAEGLAEGQKGGLDIILSDINMPVMDGLEFLKNLAGVEAATRYALRTDDTFRTSWPRSSVKRPPNAGFASFPWHW
jgi:CheY-like chemotaxis protein